MKLKHKFYGKTFNYRYMSLTIQELQSYNGKGVYCFINKTNKHGIKGDSQFVDWTTLRLKLNERSLKAILE